MLLFEIIVVILLSHFYTRIMGIAGEHWTKKELNKLPTEYIVLNDIMVSNGESTTQIDHIVVSPYGIFVIEPKHYHGFILGGDTYEKWRQYQGKKYREFHSPTRQNYGHIMALSQQLNLPVDKFISIVCFTAQVKLKVKSRTPVVHNYELNQTIIRFQNIIIGDPETIKNSILSLNITDQASRKQHIKILKEKIKN